MSKDHSGKLVSFQLELKYSKNLYHAVVILLVLNEPVGRLVNCQLELKYAKKEYPTVPLIFDVLNDHSGRLVNFHL
jgi:hypothetical protein